MVCIQGDHTSSLIGTKADVPPRHVLHPNIGDTHTLMAPKHEVHPSEVCDLSKGGMDLDPPLPTHRGMDNF